MKSDRTKATADERWLTIKEVAARLKVSRRWVQQQMKSHGLPHVRQGKSGRIVRIPEHELMLWWRGQPTADTNPDDQ